MAAPGDFAKMVPGFDFLQGLVRNAGATLPGMGQWIAPTLDPDELGKRIDQLKTVQFWLEQNARMIATTIQALEVQRMTLTTLRTMNLPVADVAQAFRAKPASQPSVQASASAAAAPAKRRTQRRSSAAAPTGAAEPRPGVVDPMKWWSALTDQFAQLAANALKEAPPKAPSGPPSAAADITRGEGKPGPGAASKRRKRTRSS